MSQFKYKIISQTLRSRNNQLFNPEISIVHMVCPRSLKNYFPKQSCHQIFCSHYSKRGKFHPTIADQMKLVWGQNNIF